jgi:hypothetical protein
MDVPFIVLASVDRIGSGTRRSPTVTAAGPARRRRDDTVILGLRWTTGFR